MKLGIEIKIITPVEIIWSVGLFFFKAAQIPSKIPSGTATITETMISYLNILTSDWDSRLALPNNTIIDGYNFSNAKARILSAYEVANIIDEPNWDKDSLSFDLEIAPYLGENLDFESWYQGGFFTLTPYDEENNCI